LLVKNGTYNEAFTIRGPAGTPTATTKILAFPGHAPIIRGGGVGSGRMKITGTSYVDFEGFTITNHNQGLYVDDDAGTGSPPDHINVRKVIIHDVGQEGIAVRGNASFVLLENVEVYNTGRLAGQNGEGIYIGGSNGSDNTHHVTVRNSLIHDVQDEGIELKAGSHDCVVEGTIIYRALSPGTSFGNTGGAIEIDGPGTYPSNPNHLIRNNIIHDILFTSGITKRGIRVGTGATIYNNILYNIASPYEAILSNSPDYPRPVYHNTIDVPSTRAIVNSGTALDSQNNIGPATTGNITTSDSLYVNKGGADYHLAPGSAAINSGVNLTSIVSTDIDGVSRLSSPPPDLGAFEYASAGSVPMPPTSLIVR
jgi:serralysin